MNLPIDLTGATFGRLTVVKLAPYKKDARWECLCVCGKLTVVRAGNLKNGHTQSCGCLLDEVKGKHSITHGASNTPAVYVWQTMIQRCTNPKHDKYKYYGGRGIVVCERWQKFENFLSDMGQPNGRQIDRKDNDGPYSKENCRWVQRVVNMRNKRNNHVVQFEGKAICISQLAEEQDIPAHALYRRISQWKMSAEQAVGSARLMRHRRG